MMKYIDLIPSTFISLYIIYINSITYEWASREAIIDTCNSLSYYLIIDTIINFKNHIKKNKLLLVHHILFYIMCKSIVNHIEINEYDTNLYNICRYTILLEIPNFFNNLRIFYGTFLTEFLFCVIYILVRTFVTIMLYYCLINNSDYDYYVIPIGILAMLNTYWSNIIIYIAKKKYGTVQKIEQWNKITRGTIMLLPLIAIKVMNEISFNYSIVVWLLFISSIGYHYQIYYNIVRPIDISLCIVNVIFTLYVSAYKNRLLEYTIFAVLIFVVYRLTFYYRSVHFLIHVLYFIASYIVI